MIPFGLRHTTTLQIAAGTDVRMVSSIMGHWETSTTMKIYAHNLKTAEQEAVNRVEENDSKTGIISDLLNIGQKRKNRTSQNVQKIQKNPGTITVSGFIFGASDLTRTGDLLITSEMHYRLCYTSILQPVQYIGYSAKCQL